MIARSAAHKQCPCTGLHYCPVERGVSADTALTVELMTLQVWQLTSDGVMLQPTTQTCLVPATIGNCTVWLASLKSTSVIRLNEHASMFEDAHPCLCAAHRYFDRCSNGGKQHHTQYGRRLMLCMWCITHVTRPEDAASTAYNQRSTKLSIAAVCLTACCFWLCRLVMQLGTHSCSLR